MDHHHIHNHPQHFHQNQALHLARQQAHMAAHHAQQQAHQAQQMTDDAARIANQMTAAGVPEPIPSSSPGFTAMNVGSLLQTALENLLRAMRR